MSEKFVDANERLLICMLPKLGITNTPLIPEQPSNEEGPTYVTVSGKTKSPVNPLHPLKAHLSILCVEFDSVNDQENLEQL